MLYNHRVIFLNADHLHVISLNTDHRHVILNTDRHHSTQKATCFLLYYLTNEDGVDVTEKVEKNDVEGHD